MLKAILDRIESRLQALGLSASTASVMAGLSKDAIRNLQRAVEAGKEDAGASTTTILKLAPILKTSASWLIEGREDDYRAPEAVEDQRLRKVTVAAHIQAGAWSEAWEWEPDDRYDVWIPDDPEYRPFRLYAGETRGPSMNKRYPERTILIFTNVAETMEEPVPGKRYIVERRRAGGEAEHTVKLLHRDDDGKYWLLPESDDPRFQAPISINEGTGDEDSVVILGRVCYAVSKE